MASIQVLDMLTNVAPQDLRVGDVIGCATFDDDAVRVTRVVKCGFFEAFVDYVLERDPNGSTFIARVALPQPLVVRDNGTVVEFTSDFVRGEA